MWKPQVDSINRILKKMNFFDSEYCHTIKHFQRIPQKIKCGREIKINAFLVYIFAK
jgi:hypothetical protein